jgi:tetratricopeptide (TPR) repeat protein/ADP-heptose:LPS heptosyltransferase
VSKPSFTQQELERLLSAAQDAMQRAEIKQAIALYRCVLDLDSQHVMANYWLGVLILKVASPQEALPHLELAASKHPEFPDFHLDLGLACQALGQTERANLCFEAARRASPGNSTEQLDLAKTLERAGKLNEAIEACRRGLALFPRSAGLHQTLAGLHLRQNCWPEALKIWQNLLQLRPDCASTHLAFGQNCYQAGDFPRAREAFQRTVELQPSLVSALLDLGLTWQKLGQPDRAFDCFQKGLQADPAQSEVHKALGDLYRETKRWDDANNAWRKAVELRPDYADAWQNLGLGLEHQGRLEEALACHRRVLQLRPNEATAHRYLGMVCQDLGDLEAAGKAYHEALRLKPNDAETRWQIFSLLAARGEFPGAWEEHEWRLKLKNRTTPRQDFSQPKWDGQDLEGRTILVYSEQGFGDSIQAVRYIPLLRKRGARVSLWCPPGLVSLLRTVPGVTDVFSQLSAANPFDFHLPLMSLPRAFGTTLATIPRHVPYLHAPSDSTVTLPAAPGTLPKVGLVWCGSQSQPNDRRPVPFECLSPLLALTGIRYYSLQLGPRAADLRRSEAAGRVIDLGPQLTDFATTAAVIEQLDLVITMDTAVAHLAGALGKPVWVLLSWAPDWRWLLHREDSPWYPTMRLFRQNRQAGWPEVVARVRQALTEWMARDDPPAPLKQRLGLGLAHHQAGRWPDAEACYRQVLEIDSRQPDALRFLGVLERQRGHWEPARQWLEKALQIQPGSAYILHDLGLVWFELGRLDEAIATYQRAIELAPKFPEAHYHLGNAYYAARKPQQAEASYQRALEQQPDLVEARYNLGLLAQEAGRPRDAILHYQQTLQLQPKHPDALLNLGLSLKDAGQVREAQACLQKSLAMDPANTKARVNLAAILAAQARHLAGQNDLLQAAKLCEEAVVEQPSWPEVWVNLGVIRQAMGQVTRAIECFQRALDLQPDNADARYNLGIAELLTGQFDSGWKNYEARWQTKNPIFATRHFPQPRWQSEALEGRTLLVYAEQGHGDTIQFARYVPLLARMGARVLLESPPSLRTLLTGLEGVTEVFSVGVPPPAFDLQIPLLSLAFRMKTTLQTIPQEIPYLHPPRDDRITWPATAGARRKIGLVWCGSGNQPNDRRPIPIEVMSPLLALEGVQFYSLQLGARSADLRRLESVGHIVDLSPQLTDFAATASAIAKLDLIITVDTAVAHLAGAMGRPVWVLLPAVPDWRWLLEREDSPWYPTMRLFRQKSPGAWTEVIDRVLAALAGRV